MRIEIAAVCAIIFGSVYTLLRKYQCVATLDDPSKQFNQPLIQAFFIFIGMTSIYFFKPFIPKEADQPAKKPQFKSLYFLPSLLDVLGTISDTAGLFYTSVSVSQMLKGSALFFTYLLSSAFGSKKISLRQHGWMGAIVVSLLMIGYSNIGLPYTKFESNPLLGNCLIIGSQLIFALMFIVEERITANYNIQVSNAVLWEGIWGILISGLFLLGFSQLDSDIIHCDILDSCELIFKNSNLLVAIILTALSIAPFNYFGLFITKNTSALQRCMFCTSRMVAVWMISLVLGWQKFSILEFLGYCLLTYSIYQFNNSSQNTSQEIKDLEQSIPIAKNIFQQSSNQHQYTNIESGQKYEAESELMIANDGILVGPEDNNI